MSSRAVLAVCALALVAPLPAAAQSGSLRAGIDKAVQSWQKAFNAGDIPAVAALYTKDALLMPPGADAVTGPEGVGAALAPVAKTREQMQLTTTDVTGSGTTALETGKWVMTSQDGKHLDHGKYLVFYKKEGGRWKIYRDIWSSSMPAK